MAKQSTKKDLISALQKQGIPLAGKETVDELKKLIADNSVTVEQAQAETADTITVKYPRPRRQADRAHFLQKSARRKLAELADESKTAHKARIVE